VPAVIGLLQLASYPCIVLDMTWKKALNKQSCLENGTYKRDQVLSVAEEMFAVNKGEVQFSKALIAIEIALKLKNVDDVKSLLQE
jgi:hypothetical protein